MTSFVRAQPDSTITKSHGRQATCPGVMLRLSGGRVSGST